MATLSCVRVEALEKAVMVGQVCMKHGVHAREGARPERCMVHVVIHDRGDDPV